MARFLSDEWIEEMAAAAATSPALAEVATGTRFTVQQEVEADGGLVRYWVRVEDGAAAFGPGPADDADVVLRADLATATAIARGELAAQDALAAGRLRLSGDVGAVVRHAPALAAADDAFADVRARTDYG